MPSATVRQLPRQNRCITYAVRCRPRVMAMYSSLATRANQDLIGDTALLEALIADLTLLEGAADLSNGRALQRHQL